MLHHVVAWLRRAEFHSGAFKETPLNPVSFQLDITGLGVLGNRIGTAA